MQQAADRIWTALSGESAELEFTGEPGPLESIFDVNGLAAGAVGVAALAAVEFLAERRGGMPAPVSVDRRNASALFASEKLLTAEGWELPPVWDPIAGDYVAADGWIRLHTNYANHRDAVVGVLGVEAERAAVAEAVAKWERSELETAVVDAGGAAAAMHSRDEWLASEAGSALADEPIVRIERRDAAWNGEDVPSPRPFNGVRVLDLTRVIAGPVATSFMGALGADVLRIDPPGFEEVPALLPLTTAGKRTAALDLDSRVGRDTFATLVEEADLIISGLRPDALGRLGLGPEELHALNPSLITLRLDAYGWDGPWRRRRGFDSLVQMSCGIAAAGMEAAGADKPVPLPVQALDHATGYIVAAAAGRALTERARDGVAWDGTCSLVGTANLLWELGKSARAAGAPWDPDDAVEVATDWGPSRTVPIGPLGGAVPEGAAPLGRDEPRWIDRY